MHAAHDSTAWLDAVLTLLAAGAIAAYATAAIVSRRRGRPWPAWRVVLWSVGIAAAAASVLGPLAAASHAGFVAHMWAHLLAGMVAPVLLVLAAPVTLALRTLPVRHARRLSRVLRSAPARLIAHPITAAVLSAGGLWAIYLTPLLDATRSNAVLHVLVHAHLLASGYLLTASLIGLDPAPHAPSRPLAAATLVVTMASHSVLAKHLYASAPRGYAAADAMAGAQLMYYGGAAVEAVVVVLFCAQWYREAGRRVGAALPGAR